MHSFPFEPTEVLTSRLEDVAQIIDSNAQLLVEGQQQVTTNPVVRSTLRWIFDVLRADPFEIASVSECFNAVLKQPKGIDVLDYALGVFQNSLESSEIQKLLNYFSPILKRYKIHIEPENLIAVSKDCKVPEGKLDLSARVDEVESSHQDDMVQRQGAPTVSDFLSGHPDHPLALQIKACASQVDGYDLSSLAFTAIESLYERFGQKDHVRIDNLQWHIKEDPNFDVTLIFSTGIFSEKGECLADHSLVYSLTQKEDGVYGNFEQFILRPYNNAFHRICVASALFSDHLFPLEAPESLFMNNLEDRVVLDRYWELFSSSMKKSIQEQIGFFETLITDAEISLHALALLAVLQVLQQQGVKIGGKIDSERGWLEDLLEYREGTHFLDYVLGKFYKKAFANPEKQQSKKMMHVLIHHFLPMMLERKIVYPHLWYVGHTEQGNRIVVEPLTNSFKELNEKYRDPEQRAEIVAFVETRYATDRDRGISLLDAVLQSSPGHKLALFLKALLSQGTSFGDYGVVNGSAGPLIQWFLEAGKSVSKNNFDLSLDEITGGYRVSIRHGYCNLSDKLDPEKQKISELSFFNSSLTFELTWNEKQEKAELRFIGLGYTPYDNEAAPVFARQQCFGGISKQPQMVCANTPMPKDPEQYRPYLLRFLFSENPEAVSHRWSDYFQRYMHLSLSVRPVFLDVIDQSNLSSEEKETIFKKIFERQIKEFFKHDAKFELFQTFCFGLTPHLQVLFYRYLKCYFAETHNNATDENRRKTWLKNLEKQQLNGDALPVLEQDFMFWEGLKSFISEAPISDDESLHISFQSGKTFALSENAHSWLLDENGNFREPPTDRAGTHCVFTVCSDIPYDPNLNLDEYKGPVYEVVFWPDMPSFAMQRLAQRVFGEKILPRAAVARLDYRGKIIAIEIREHVKGRLLSNVLKESPDDLNRINSVSFTRNFLFFLLLLISDLHGRNAVLQASDNDSFDFRVFDARAFKEQEDMKKPELINMFFLLDLMRIPILDPDVFHQFLTLDFDMVLKAWIEECRVENSRLSMLFNGYIGQLYESGKEKFNTTRPVNPLETHKLNSSLLCIPIGGYVQSLFFRMKKLREELEVWTNESPFVILRHVLSLLSKFYKPCFKKGAVQERFDHLLQMAQNGLSSSTYSSRSLIASEPTATTTQYNFLLYGEGLRGITKALGYRRSPFQLSKEEVEEIANERDDFFSPTQAKGLLEQLIAFYEQEDHSTIVQLHGDLLRKKPFTLRFEQLFPEEKYLCLERLYKHIDEIKILLTREQQRAILDILLVTPFSSLSLHRYAQVLKDRDILKLMNGPIYHLRTLNLNETLLTDSAMEHLSRATDLPLEHLILSNMPNLRLMTPNLKLNFPNLRILDLRGSGNIRRLPFVLPNLKELYLDNNWGIESFLRNLIDRQSEQKIVIHLSGEAKFAIDLIHAFFRVSNVHFEIDDPNLQSSVLYDSMKTGVPFFSLGDYLKRVIDQLHFLPRFEQFVISRRLEPNIYMELSLIIQPIIKEMKRIKIIEGWCDSELILFLLRCFPSVNQIDLEMDEEKFSIRLDEWRQSIRFVAMTDHYVAIRFNSPETEEVLYKLGFLDRDSHQVEDFPNCFFFHKETIQALVGDSINKKKVEREDFSSFLSIKDERITALSIDMCPDAWGMFVEIACDYARKHPECLWCIHLNDAMLSDLFFLGQINFPQEGSSLVVSSPLAQKIVDLYWERWSGPDDRSSLLNILLSLRVSEEYEKQFCDQVFEILSADSLRSPQEKYCFLKKLVTVYSVPVLTELVGLYEGLQSHQTMSSEAQKIAAIYQEHSAHIDRLWPKLWLEIQRLAVQHADVQDYVFACLLFDVVFARHEERIDQCSCKDWEHYYQSLKEEDPNSDLSDLIHRRVQLLVQQKRKMVLGERALFKRLLKENPQNQNLRNVLLLYGDEHFYFVNELKKAVQWVVDCVGGPECLNHLCYAPCNQDGRMDKRQTIIAAIYLQEQFERRVDESLIGISVLQKIQHELFLHHLPSLLYVFSGLSLSCLEEMEFQDADSDSDWTTKSLVDWNPNEETDLTFFGQRDERSASEKGPVRDKPLSFIQLLILESSVYHWLSSKEKEIDLKVQFQQLMEKFSLENIFVCLRDIEVMTRKKSEGVYLYQCLADADIASAFLASLESLDRSQWSVRLHIYIGALFIRTGHEQLREYGTKCLKELLEMAFAEDSQSYYFRGRAAYLLEDYQQAYEHFQSALQNQVRDHLLGKTHINNIKIWQKQCAHKVGLKM